MAHSHLQSGLLGHRGRRCCHCVRAPSQLSCPLLFPRGSTSTWVRCTGTHGGMAEAHTGKAGGPSMPPRRQGCQGRSPLSALILCWGWGPTSSPRDDCCLGELTVWGRSGCPGFEAKRAPGLLEERQQRSWGQGWGDGPVEEGACTEAQSRGMGTITLPTTGQKGVVSPPPSLPSNALDPGLKPPVSQVG